MTTGISPCGRQRWPTLVLVQVVDGALTSIKIANGRPYVLLFGFIHRKRQLSGRVNAHYRFMVFDMTPQTPKCRWAALVSLDGCTTAWGQDRRSSSVRPHPAFNHWKRETLRSCCDRWWRGLMRLQAQARLAVCLDWLSVLLPGNW